ncbi:hypothetical protein K438DRAFT_277950 [Mycena galopus ATCC 62051]|nr:hypothetical protein K438DRAFT_277950 [Mycena galopus ATCC 62051]
MSHISIFSRLARPCYWVPRSTRLKSNRLIAKTTLCHRERSWLGRRATRAVSYPRPRTQHLLLGFRITILMLALTRITAVVWYRSRPAVYAELAPLVSFHGALLLCPYCSATTRRRLYKEDALHAHMVWSHPHHVAEPVAVPPNTHRCTLCPPSATSVYDPQTLLRHIDNVYVLRQSPALTVLTIE